MAGSEDAIWFTHMMARYGAGSYDCPGMLMCGILIQTKVFLNKGLITKDLAVKRGDPELF